MNFKKAGFLFLLALVALLGASLLAPSSFLVQAQNIGSLKTVVSTGFSFTMDLQAGYTDADVLELQRVLNADVDTTVALDGDGSRGKETKYFGEKTKQAVIKFQEKYRDVILTPAGLTKGTGIVNKATRTKLNLLIGVFDTYDSVGSPESRGSTGGASGGATVSAPVVPVVTAPVSSQPTMTNCQFVELLISIEAITANNANAARSAVGCPVSSLSPYAGARPSVTIRVNGERGVVSISSPRSVTVSWSSSNVSSCSSPGGNVKSTSGSQSFYVDTSGTFDISCTGSYGTVTDSVAVSMGDNSTSNNSSSISVACYSSPSQVGINTPLVWIASVSGGDGNYTYAWSGTDNLSSGYNFISRSYASAGLKNATVVVTSNGRTATANCSATITSSTSGTTATSTFDYNKYLSSLGSTTTNFFGYILKTITGPSDVRNVMGYGIVNNWMNIDSASLAIQLANNKLTATDIELLGFATDGYYDNPTVLQSKLKTFISNMRIQNITTLINIVNWNKGAGVDENGDISICDARYDDVWFNGLLDMVITATASSTNATASSTDKVILQSASEWSSASSSGGRNSQCFDKAQHWEDLMNARWTGMKSTNKGTRPTSSPRSGWFFEYHPCKTTDLGASGSVVTTDCGGILSALGRDENMRALADAKVLRSYACKVISSGDRGFLYYGFGHRQIDSEAITALGQVAANPYSCSSLEEVEGPTPTIQFGGIVTAVGPCTPRKDEGMKMYKVSISACKAGETVSNPNPGAPGAMTSEDGYVVIRERHQSVPSVGETIKGDAVHDGGEECTNGGGRFIGTVTGRMGTGDGSFCPVSSAPATDGGGGPNFFEKAASAAGKWVGHHFGF